jgi:hypothetical protein
MKHFILAQHVGNWPGGSGWDISSGVMAWSWPGCCETSPKIPYSAQPTLRIFRELARIYVIATLHSIRLLHTQDVAGSLACPGWCCWAARKHGGTTQLCRNVGSHSHQSNILAGHGISSICRRKATMMPPFFFHRTEALGGPQRSTSSRLAALPPARGKRV